MQAYIRELKSQKSSTYLHHWQHILSLKVSYRSDDLVNAVRRALKYRVYDSRAIENFLKVNAQKQTEIDFSFKNTADDKKQ